MEWRSERRGDDLVATPSEPLDHENANDLYELLAVAIKDAETAGGNLVIDLSEVSYMSSVGLRALARAAKLGREKSVSIAVASLNGTMMEIFQITRFDKLFGIFDSVDAALET